MKKKFLLFFICIIAAFLLVFSACDKPDDKPEQDACPNGGTHLFSACDKPDDKPDQDACPNGGTHLYTVENKCSFCNNVLDYSDGLVFKLNSDKMGYSVSLGTCTDTEIVIPYGYSDKPVTRINANAFYQYTDLKNITIPDSVKHIGEHSFADCYKLTSINYRGTEEQWNAISKGQYWKPPYSPITYNYTGK